MIKGRVLIIGLGSIGKRHARLLQQHFPYELVALRSLRSQGQNDLGIPEVYSWDEVDGQSFDVAVIANPTFMHLDTALRCARRGFHLFLEKPIDCTLSGLSDLLKTVQDRKLSAYVAYPLRFHAVVRRLKEQLAEHTVLHASLMCASFLPDWRPGRDYRTVHSHFRDQGGGVLLEMSHELDMAEYLFGPILEIKGVLNRVSDLTADADDCADLVVSHGSRTTNIHLNLFSRCPRRFVEIDTSDGYLRGDLRDPSITGIVGNRKIDERFVIDADSMYVEQLRYFFNNLGRTDMMNSLAQASNLYRTMIEFREEQGYGSVDNHLRPRGFAGG